jgi:hypothetical protein
MSARDRAGFGVQVGPSGTLLLRGELDLATVQDLQDWIEEVLVPGKQVILDLAQLTFLEQQRHPLLQQDVVREWPPGRVAKTRLLPFGASCIWGCGSPKHGCLTGKDP